MGKRSLKSRYHERQNRWPIEYQRRYHIWDYELVYGYNLRWWTNLCKDLAKASSLQSLHIVITVPHLRGHWDELKLLDPLKPIKVSNFVVSLPWPRNYEPVRHIRSDESYNFRILRPTEPQDWIYTGNQLVKPFACALARRFRIEHEPKKRTSKEIALLYASAPFRFARWAALEVKWVVWEGIEF